LQSVACPGGALADEPARQNPDTLCITIRRDRRRLPALVAHALAPELSALLARLAAAFPPVAACLAAAAGGAPADAPGPLGGGRASGADLGDLEGSDSEAEGAGHTKFLE